MRGNDINVSGEKKKKMNTNPLNNIVNVDMRIEWIQRQLRLYVMSGQETAKSIRLKEELEFLVKRKSNPKKTLDTSADRK